MTSTQDNRFIHGKAARILIGLIGVLLLGFIFVRWENEVKAFAGSFSGGEDSKVAQQSGSERVSEENPALAACLEERLGHVKKMQEDGVIGDKQAAAFSQRATTLCNAQNPA